MKEMKYDPSLEQKLIRCNKMLILKPDDHELHYHKAHFLFKLGQL